MNLENVTIIHTPPSAKRFPPPPPPDENALYKNNFATGELSKVIDDINTAAQGCS